MTEIKHDPQVGDRMGKLTVVEIELRLPIGSNGRTNRAIRVRCDCGTEMVRHLAPMFRPNAPVLACRRCAWHMKRPAQLRRMWTAIIGRCYNPNDHGFHNYGGRGIGIWPAWRNDPQGFADWILANLGERPTPEHSLDRICNDCDYQPGNLRWATMQQQAANSRRHHEPVVI